MAGREFTRSTRMLALARQRNRCASCGEKIHSLGKAGAAKHRFGEAIHAHHAAHAKFGGNNSVSNCVIICESCHYSIHEGGNYRSGTVQFAVEEFPYYKG
jgi:5-methylcytosine-specific restriction endonuclease McrA